MNPPVVLLSSVDAINVRMMAFASTGDFEYIPAPETDSMLLLAKGKFTLEIKGEATELVAPRIAKIKAGLAHKIIAISDGAVAYTIVSKG